MIDFLHVEGLRVLLVGEGNFSFTIALLKKSLSLTGSVKLAINVISTCYQSFRELLDENKRNVRLANKLGAEIWFGVDGTNLHNHESLKDLSFDVIIFNFPHVGGKMKIHLNRKLLKDFFISSSFLLADNGSVLVTLCQGQSGTHFDQIQRKNGDTWQIVMMATYGDLILKKASPFRSEDWPEYYCNGYRSLEKGFHLTGAWTFYFIKSFFKLQTIEYSIFEEENHCPFDSLIDNDSQFLVDTEPIFNYLKTFSCGFRAESATLKLCVCNCDVPWWEIFFDDFKCRYVLYKLLICHNNQNGDPLQRIVFFSISSSDIETFALPLNFVIHRCLKVTEVNKTLKSVAHYQDTISKSRIMSILEKPETTVVALYLDEFIQLKTHFPHLDCKFPDFFDWPIQSLYPPLYVHHLSMWVPPWFSHQKFQRAIRFACRDAVRHVKLIDQFHCQKTDRASVCYQFEYQSLDGALSPDVVKQLHCSVIRVLVKHLGVTVR